MENDPLAAYLAALARDDCYRVDEVLKTAPHETTEVVYFVGANAAELGPFVRKRIAVDAAMGDAYGHLFRAQRAGRRFRHLPRIYDVHTTGDELVVVMEYIQGRTLRDEVYERDGSLALAAQWFPLLCDGVMELHEQFSPPLIHRDLKPSNIVVSDAGLTIIDFGIARAFLHDAPFLLLDEPTSNLDSLNEGIILKSLRESCDKKTVVLVSHRQSTMQVADEVYEMENGRIS